MMQDGNSIEEDDESDRETQLLQIELQIMKAVEHKQMLQQVSNQRFSRLFSTGYSPSACSSQCFASCAQ